MNYYVTPEQEKWLLANGLKPYCPEKGVTLLEAAQWFWDNHKIECSYKWTISDKIASWNYCADTKFTPMEQAVFNTIPEALSWAIDQAINHVNNQSNDNI